MSNTALKLSSVPSSSKKPSSSEDDIQSILNKRRSKSLYIALGGPIGCGIKGVTKQLESVLLEEQYKVIHIRVSELMELLYKKTDLPPLTYDPTNKAERYNALMDAGDELRISHGFDVGAGLALAFITKEVEKLLADNPQQKNEMEEDKEEAKETKYADPFRYIKEIAYSERIAFVIDQLKHPDEVHALKSVLGSVFYFVGVLCDEERRKTSLQDEGISISEAIRLIQRDRDENLQHGQQLEKTLHHADFFISNSTPNVSNINRQLARFLKLAHGGKGITPTNDESGMYAAHSASLQSACLSRQVGASITDSEGNILSLGHNDVPKFGGGLYSENDTLQCVSSDNRCVHRDQRCHNDLHKIKLRDRVENLLSDYLKNNLRTSIDSAFNTSETLKATAKTLNIDELAKKILAALNPAEIAQNLYKNSQIKSLIEYSRAIHAEMDAIVSLARRSSRIPPGSILYSTTFPCHNCARHIIAAGIARVVYIEPYEKSLAINLHDDALSYTDGSKKVLLAPFQGVAPARYKMFFENTTPKKDSEGRMIVTSKTDSFPVDTSPVDSYIERASRFSDKFLKTLWRSP